MCCKVKILFSVQLNCTTWLRQMNPIFRKYNRKRIKTEKWKVKKQKLIFWTSKMNLREKRNIFHYLKILVLNVQHERISEYWLMIENCSGEFCTGKKIASNSCIYCNMHWIFAVEINAKMKNYQRRRERRGGGRRRRKKEEVLKASPSRSCRVIKVKVK